MAGLIGRGTRIAFRQKRVKVMQPGVPIPDGDGGFTVDPIPANPPAVWAHIDPATTRDLERLTGGTVTSQATHVVTLPFHPEITLQSQLIVEDYPHPDRTFSVLGISNPDERDADLVLFCTEIVQ